MSQSNKNLMKSHVRSSSMLVAGRMFGVGVNFLVQVLTVRFLPKEEFGSYALAMSIVTVASIINAFGMDKAASRFLPVFLERNEHGKFWGALRIMIGAMSVVGLAAIGLIGIGLAYDWPLLPAAPVTQTVLAVLALLSVTHSFDAFFVAVFAALSRADAIFIRRHVLGPLLKLIAAGAACLLGGNVVWFASGQLVAALIGFAIYLHMFNQILRSSDLAKSKAKYPAKELFCFSGTVFSGDLAFMLRGAFVPVVIGALFASSEVAAFQAVMPIARLNEVVMNTFAIMFVPAVARLLTSGDTKRLSQLYAQNTIWTTVLSFPIFVVSFAAASQVSQVLFGDTYSSSGIVLSILSVGYFANAVFGVNIRMLRVSGKLRTLIVVDVITILAAVLFMGICVPRYGAVGGAWATTATFFVQLMAVQFATYKTTPINTYEPRYLIPFVAGLVIALFVRQGLSVTDFSPIFSIVVALTASLILPILFFHQINLTEFFPELRALKRTSESDNTRHKSAKAREASVDSTKLTKMETKV